MRNVDYWALCSNCATAGKTAPICPVELWLPRPHVGAPARSAGAGLPRKCEERKIKKKAMARCFVFFFARHMLSRLRRRASHPRSRRLRGLAAIGLRHRGRASASLLLLVGNAYVFASKKTMEYFATRNKRAIAFPSPRHSFAIAQSPCQTVFIRCAIAPLNSSRLLRALPCPRRWLSPSEWRERGAQKKTLFAENGLTGDITYPRRCVLLLQAAISEKCFAFRSCPPKRLQRKSDFIG